LAPDWKKKSRECSTCGSEDEACRGNDAARGAIIDRGDAFLAVTAAAGAVLCRILMLDGIRIEIVGISSGGQRIGRGKQRAA